MSYAPEVYDVACLLGRVYVLCGITAGIGLICMCMLCLMLMLLGRKVSVFANLGLSRVVLWAASSDEPCE